MHRKKKHSRENVISNAFVTLTIGALCSASVPAKPAQIVHQPESIPARVEKLREKLSKQGTNVVAEREQSGQIIDLQWIKNTWDNWNNWEDWGNS
jgi:hypothetical protein